MKTNKFLLMVTGLIAFIAMSCQKSEMPIDELSLDFADMISVSADGATEFLTKSAVPVFEDSDELTADEIEFLFAAREEEKLARDIYSHFYDKFLSKPFSIIGKAEETHIAAIERLFYFYSIDYPQTGEPGVFENQERQDYYNRLIAQGDSLLGAYMAAAFLEERDIFDYNEVLKDIENPNIKMVIEHLYRGSVNHFKAMLRQIDALGSNYECTFLSQEEFDSIINSNFLNGKRYQVRGSGSRTNNGNGYGLAKGAVNSEGVCTRASNGNAPGSQQQAGKTGKGFRGGR
ncbi:MAG: DUF2202 domain-containing protein [Rikenellaceae bacterium]|nr:DUF2202 domain-containing protein [Rikenellaceae bacterium]